MSRALAPASEPVSSLKRSSDEISDVVVDEIDQISGAGAANVKAARTAAIDSKDGVAHFGVDTKTNELVADFEEQLTCGMCAAIFFHPVALEGCGHVFCGSCIQNWINTTKTLPVDPDSDRKPLACPNCRKSPLTMAYPSHLVGSMVEILLKYRPEAARPVAELRQADQIYVHGSVISFNSTTKKFRVPDAVVQYWRPCPYCNPTDPDAWSCPLPVPDPNDPIGRLSAMRADGICPDGHAVCAGCLQLSPAEGPKSRKCDVCCEGYCGRDTFSCACSTASEARATYCLDELYHVIVEMDHEAILTGFHDNEFEIKHLASYIRAHPTKNSHSIYRDIIKWAVSPEGLRQGGIIEILRVGTRGEVNQALALVIEGEEQSRICGSCVDDIVALGLFGWFGRELLNLGDDASPAIKAIRDRPRCRWGYACEEQYLAAHNRKFSHLYEPCVEEEHDAIPQNDRTGAAAVVVHPYLYETSSDDESTSSEKENEGDDHDESVHADETAATTVYSDHDTPEPRMLSVGTQTESAVESTIRHPQIVHSPLEPAVQPHSMLPTTPPLQMSHSPLPSPLSSPLSNPLRHQIGVAGPSKPRPAHPGCMASCPSDKKIPVQSSPAPEADVPAFEL